MAAKKKLAEEKGSGLYIPIRDYEQRGWTEEIPYDLSELCYLLKQGKGLKRDQVVAAIEREGKDSFLRGFHYPEHLIGLSTEVSQVLDVILKECNYETVVLDLQFLLPDYQRILSMASEIYIVDDGLVGTKENKQLEDEIVYLEGKKILPNGICRVWKWQRGEEHDVII